MSSKSTLDDFLSILKDAAEETEKIYVNGRTIALTPLDFKHQKSLVTTGLDGLIGVISFIHQLNTAIIDSTNLTDLRLTDRVQIALHLRRMLTDKPIIVENKEISILSLIDNAKEWEGLSELSIGNEQFTIKLEIPTLSKENKFLIACVEELKSLQDGGLGENIAAMLEYEIPKFIKCIEFGEKVIDFDSINIKEKIKIVNNLPASVTTEISEFIRKISEYDEKTLTLDDLTVDLDSSLFE